MFGVCYYTSILIKIIAILLQKYDNIQLFVFVRYRCCINSIDFFPVHIIC